MRTPDSEAEYVARETMTHAARIAKELGEPLTAEEARHVIERVSRTIPDPEFGALVAKKAEEYLP